MSYSSSIVSVTLAIEQGSRASGCKDTTFFLYDERKFDNGCPKGKCEECPKFGYKPCWDIYYKKVHKAKTYNKKIDLLKSFKGKKEDN